LVANTEVLLAALADTYDVSVIQDGPTALAALATVKPDLILLDIMMPGMDGYEVCTQLQANPGTRDIPVIFLTALSEDSDEEKGLNLGAADYITKPFNPALVKARVRNHLALRHTRIEVVRQRDQVEVALQKLRKLEQQRDDLVHMIVHDLRGPLTGMVGYLDMLARDKANAPNFERDLCAAQKSTKALCDMVSALLDVSRLETGLMPLRSEASDVGQLTHLALERLGALTYGRRILVHIPAHPIMAHCDSTITGRILQNLLDNALKFTSPEGCIQITVVPEESCVRLSIADTGPGIAAEYHEKVFQKFCQVEARTIGSRRSTGLGLAFCKLAVEAQGGSIRLESEPGRGATFHLRLPLAAGKAEG
jgi:K+-sensing histidine kinase KdpD